MRPARVSLPQGCEDTLPYVTNQYSLACDQRSWLCLSFWLCSEASAQRGTRILKGAVFCFFLTA